MRGRSWAAQLFLAERRVRLLRRTVGPVESKELREVVLNAELRPIEEELLPRPPEPPL